MPSDEGRPGNGQGGLGLPRFLLHTLALAGARVVLAIVFLSAAIPKLWHLEDFAIVVHNYRLLPASLVGVAAVALPGIEVSAAIGLLTRRLRRAAAWVIALLSSTFAVAVSSAVIRGLNIECGCFSVFAERRVGYGLLAQDMVLLLLACYCTAALAWQEALPTESGAQ